MPLLGGGIISPQSLYHYSISNSDNHISIEKRKTALLACERILDLNLIKDNPEIEKIQRALYVKHCLQIAKQMAPNGEGELKDLRNRAKKYALVFLLSSHVSIKQKLGFVILETCPRLLKHF